MSLNLIVKMKFGSHLYGTSTSDSDIDYKGVFLPSKAEVLLGKIPKCHNYSSGSRTEKNTPQDVDIEIYSLHYFINLACEGQTVALDMLHAPDSVIETGSGIWSAIVNERSRFYTRNLKSFITYARRQAGKYGIKGSRLNAVSEVLKFLKSEVSTQKRMTRMPTLKVSCRNVCRRVLKSSRGSLIPDGPMNPRTVHTVARGSNGHLGLYRIEIQMTVFKAMGVE
ncbi:nucleotidyltransferase domain-containing protein [Candidatus Desantisbacteria bacterium]|nr:nucleotidyltransferase domain-containing protein [Candidatus Desantisbacteria bacterium]